MRPSGPAIAAAAVLTFEAIAIAVVALIELFALGSGATGSTMSAVALIVLTLVAAALLGVFAIGTLRKASWARSGGILVQVLGLALSLGALSIEPKPWTFILGVGVTALVGFALLIATTRRDGSSDPRLQQRAADSED